MTGALSGLTDLLFLWLADVTLRGASTQPRKQVRYRGDVNERRNALSVWERVLSSDSYFLEQHSSSLSADAGHLRVGNEGGVEFHLHIVCAVALEVVKHLDFF